MDPSSPLSRLPERLLRLSGRHRTAAWILLAAALVLATAAAVRGRYSHDLGLLFPPDALSGRMVQVMANSGLDNMIQLELESGRPGGAPALLAGAERLAARLSALPAVRAVDFKLAGGATQDWGELIPAWPLLTDAAILADADPVQAVQGLRRALTLPAAPLAAWRADPFGWQRKIMLELRELHRLAGLNISLQHPFLTDPEASRLLLNVQADLGGRTGAETIATLLAQISQAAAVTLPDARLNLVSPLRHTMENEQAIRRDLVRVSLASLLALLLLFFVLYRRALDAIWIPLCPLAATLLVTGLLALCFDRISLLIMGLAGSLAGLAVDQGIHVYAAYAGNDRQRRLARIFLPLLMGATTSALVFLMAGTTGITAYVQLGLFAGGTLLANFLLSFFWLPDLLRPRAPRPVPLARFQPGPRAAAAVAGGWLLLSAAAVCTLPALKTDFNLSALDGARPETLQSEEDFQRRWRRPEAGRLIVVNAANRDELLRRCEIIADRSLAGDGRSFHPASLWPSPAIRASHLHSWRRPETAARLRELEAALARECRQAALPPAFYGEFFAALRRGIEAGDSQAEPLLFQEVNRRLIRTRRHGVTGLFFFDRPLPEADLQTLLAQLDRLGDCALLSADAFRTAASGDFRPLASRVMACAAAALLLILAPVYRSPRQLLVIALPGLTAALWFAGLAAATGTPLTIASCLAMIMLTGLVIDYGIFALHQLKEPGETSLATAMLLSAATTLLTAGALLFARHPFLFHTGLVLSAEILAAALTALYVIPALATLFRRRGKHRLLSAIPLFLLLLAAGCRTPSAPPFPARPLAAADAAREWQAFLHAQSRATTQALTMKVDILWYSLPMIVVVQRDPANQRLAATGMLPSGNLVFSVSGSPGHQEQHTVSPAVPIIAREKIFATIFADLCNIFLFPTVPGTFTTAGHTPCRQRLPDGIRQILDGDPLRPMQMKKGHFPNRKWIVYYADWEKNLSACQSIVYKNFTTGCTLTFTPQSTPTEGTSP